MYVYMGRRLLGQAALRLAAAVHLPPLRRAMLLLVLHIYIYI